MKSDRTVDLCKNLMSSRIRFKLLFEWPVTSARPVDYIAPVNPCRLVDRFCSVKCKLWQMEGQFDCDFCVCPNKTDYVKWETTPASTLSPLPTATLPPDTIIVNNIKYHRVGDPCRLSRDGMCPSTCTELHSTSRSGSACTQCDCRGAAVLIGRSILNIGNNDASLFKLIQ